MGVKHRIIFFMSFLFLAFSGGANAYCTYEGVTGLAVHMAFPDIPPIDRGAPMNSVLATVSATNNVINVVNCPRAEPIYHYVLFPHLGAGIYASGIPGVGLRILHNANYVPQNWTLVPGRNMISVGEITLELVKVGDITGGGKIGSNLSSLNFLNILDESSAMKAMYFRAPLEVKLANPTCSVDTAVMDVDAGSVNLSELAVTGRSPAKNFTIDLTCSGGTGSATTDVYVTLTDQNQISNRTTQLTLTRGGATGVVMEVNNKNGLVSFGADSQLPGNPGQWLEGSATNGAFSIPLSVNYLQVDPNPQPGVANAVASYTLSYQ
ncbi:fimbrial protein [Pseudomonas reactans]